MEPPKCLCLVLLLLLLFQFVGCYGCLVRERNALLVLKDSLVDRLQISDTFLTWFDDKGSDCCQWERVECNKTTRQVVLLSLDSIAQSSLDGTNVYLNASLFLPFEDLRHLDLSGNYFSGWRHNEGLERLSKLKELQALNLSYNNFDSSLFQSLSKLTSLVSLNLGGSFKMELTVSELIHGFERLANLKILEDFRFSNDLYNNMIPLFDSVLPLRTLDLRNNYLNGSLTKFPQGWRKIRVLDLSHNDFSGKIPAAILSLKELEALSLRANNLIGSLSGICELRNLWELDLSWNNLEGSIPPCLSNLTNLRMLDLSYNNLEGNVPPTLTSNWRSLRVLEALSLSENNLTGSISEICEFRNLLELDLSRNNLEGSIPPCLRNLTNLRLLDLSGNRFTGNIPPSLTCNWKSLRVLDLSLNQLTGTIPPSLLHNLTQLVYISFSNNLLKGNSLLTSLPDCKCQLGVICLSNCNLHLSTTHLLTSLHTQFNIETIDLSHNNIYGKYPNWLTENNTRLEALSLNNNSFSGHIHFSSLPTPTYVKLLHIDISDNHIHGKLQNDFGNLFPIVEYLNFSNNGIQGCIPPSIGNMTTLQFLDLSHNNFSGEIPSISGIYFTAIKLSNNRLQGKIPTLPCSYLTLSNNKLTGFRWGSVNLTYLQSFERIDISQNGFSGTLPMWIGNLTEVEYLTLAGNRFDGPIPPEICYIPGITHLDLSRNKLSGSIPPCLNFTWLQSVHLQGNKLTGEIPRAISNSKDLVMLNLGDNMLSGRVPDWLGLLQSLRVVVLRGNVLGGFIPYKLCQLIHLDILDLSQNHLSGSIPMCFRNSMFRMSEEKNSYTRLTDWEQYFFLENTWSVLLQNKYFDPIVAEMSNEYQEEVEFMTKNRYDSYKGDILNFMSGIDLSCNNLTGEIPQEIGALTALHALNLSHNQLTGSIPTKFSELKSIESMDLSHNNLSGEIPSELSVITTLSVFIVSYNNLSGRVPEKQQFSTFGETSYEGNPLLCGQLLQKQCDDIGGVSVFTASAEKFGMDPISLIASCIASYAMTLIVLVVVLYINRYWRRMWFDFIDRILIFVFPSWTETIFRDYRRRRW